MACNINEAVEALKTDSKTGKIVRGILTQDEASAVKFDANVVKVLGKSALTNYKDYLQGFSSLLFANTNPIVFKDVKLKEAQLKYATAGVLGGAYNPEDNTISLVKEPTVAEVREAIDAMTDKSLKEKLPEVYLESLEQNVASELKSMVFRFGPPTVLHELVHSNTGDALSAPISKRSEAAKRVYELYEIAKDSTKYDTNGHNRWEYDVHEFIAEGLSNPQFMKALHAVPAPSGMKKFSSLFEEIYYSLIGLLGFDTKTTDSIFEVLLDAQLKIIEDAETPTHVNQVTTEQVLANAAKYYSPEVIANAKRLLADACTKG